MSDASKFSPDNGLTIYDIKDKNGRIMSEQLIRDTVGWTGKNKAIPLKGYVATGDPSTGYGIVVNDNSLCYITEIENGKSYTVTRKSGQGNRFRVILFNNYPTATLDMTANQIVFDNNLNEYTFTNTTYKYALFGVSSNGGDNPDTIEGMICLATISDDTYEPYHESVEDDIRAIGTLNEILFPYSQTSYTSNDITFTVQDDYGIKINGQKSAAGGSTGFYVYDSVPIKDSIFKKGHSYRLLGFNNTLTHSWSGLTMLVRVQNASDSEHYEINWADGKPFTIPDQYFTDDYSIRIQISIISNFNVENQVIYPMLIESKYNCSVFWHPKLNSIDKHVTIRSRLSLGADFTSRINNANIKLVMLGKIVEFRTEFQITENFTTGSWANGGILFRGFPKGWVPCIIGEQRLEGSTCYLALGYFDGEYCLVFERATELKAGPLEIRFMYISDVL